MSRPRLTAAIVAISIFYASTALADDYLTGSFRLARQPAEILEPDVAAALDRILKKNKKLEWQVYVPEDYSPDRPAGLYVYVDPEGHGRIPDGWQRAFAANNVIWLGVRQTKRNVSEQQRVWHAILGSRAIAEDYEIALQHMYVGGKQDTVLSALNTLLTANEFSGAIYTRGSYPLDQLNADQLQALQRKSHVFISDANDNNKTRVQSDFDSYQRKGIYDVKLVFNAGGGGRMPSAEEMDEALRFLISPFSE